VRVVGIVVAIEQYAQRRIYGIDDSSGMNVLAVVTSPAPIKAKNDSAPNELRPNNDAQPTVAQVPDPYAAIDVGMVVDVKGGVSSFRNERQIDVVKMVIVQGTAQEVALWEKRTKFRREVLDVPWVLRDKDVRRCRREAERSEAEARAEQKRAKQKKKATKHGRDRDEGKEMGVRDVKKQDVKHTTKGSKSTGLVDEDAAKRVQRLIREGASSGRFNALGL
jgi:endo-1,3(4)-beta-glucanase